jgi:hypothetical protein
MAPTGSSGTTPPLPTLLAPTTKGTRKTMTNKPLLTSSKSLEEHIAGAGTRTDITNLSTARKILSTHGLVLLASASSMKHVIQAIFKLSLTVNSRATFTEILRALGIILHEIDQSIDVNNLINKINLLVGGPLVTLNEVVETLEMTAKSQTLELVETVTKVSDQIQISTKNLEKTMENTTNQLIATNHTSQAGARSDGPKTCTPVQPEQLYPLH